MIGKPSKRRWWIAAGGTVVAAVFLLCWLFLRPEGAMARITYDGEVVMTVRLDQDREFALEQDPTVRFRIRDGAISFVDATCPDKICQRAGYLSRVGETAACLPRKTVVTVIAGPEKGEADAVAG